MLVNAVIIGEEVLHSLNELFFLQTTEVAEEEEVAAPSIAFLGAYVARPLQLWSHHQHHFPGAGQADR